MHKLELKALQMPQIYLDGEIITFPYKKTEALFYYIAIEKTTTRDIVSTLLWENSDTETARKNLRHALYVLKKTFGFDVITSSKGSVLSIHPDIVLKCDVDELLENNNMDVYQGPFLQNFFLKKSNVYEEWLERTRDQLQNIYLIKLYNYIITIPYDNLSEIELQYNKYIVIDPFDERVSIALMKAYQFNRLYLKGIKVYQKLHKAFNEELGIVPGKDITELYRQIRIEWAELSAEETQEDNPIVKGRSKEALDLKTCLQSVLNGAVRCVMIDGENGVGKTYLIQNLLDNISEENIYQINSSCYSVEKSTPLYPWNSIIFQLEECIIKNNISIPKAYVQVVSQFFPTFLNQSMDHPTMPIDIDNSFNFRAVQNGIYKILAQIIEYTPILLVLDNFHYSDIFSRQLLAFLLREKRHNFMVIFTCLDTLDDEMFSFISGLKKDQLLTQIHLDPFSKEETNEIVQKTLNVTNLDSKTLDRIYEETSGNAFFLNELLTTYKDHGTDATLSSNAQNILAERLEGISTEAKQILNIISLFYDYTTLDILEVLLNRNALDILNSIEELKMRSLIKERLYHGIIQFYFTHNKMREFVESKISPSKQKVLHNSIGYALEQISPKNLPSHYAQLTHHFSRGGNTAKMIEYQIYSFEDISVTMFELYPSLLNSLEPIEPENISEYFIALENNLEKAHKDFNNDEQFQNLHARLLIAKGRYFILTGLYCDGLISIKASLQMPYVKNNPNYMLISLRQMVYYSIQLYQLDMMKDYIDEGLSIARSSDNWLELALFQRLNGLLQIMANQLDDAYDSLLQSITLIETHSVRNSNSIINIAAAYNYIGELYRKQKNFEEAVFNYEHAISLCTEYNVSINATFYTNLGYTYLENGNQSKAYEYFLIASDIYDNSFTLMGHSIAKGYSAIYYCENGQFELARKALKEAQKAVKQLGSPYEKGLLRHTQGFLKSQYASEFKEILREDTDFYYTDSKRLLEPLGVEVALNF